MAAISKRSLAIFISLIAHLGLVPLMSVYGLQVCPVLREHGFTFGCRYNLAFVVLSLSASVVTNTLIFFLLKARTEQNKARLNLRDFSWISSAVHFTIFACGILMLRNYLTSLDLPGPSLIRMTTAFFIASIFLSILQGEIFDWAILSWLRTAPQWAHLHSSDPISEVQEQSRIFRRWLTSELSRTIPFWAGIVVTIAYSVSKILEIQEMYDVEDTFIQTRFQEALQIVGLAVGWLFAVEFVRMKKEAQTMHDINLHINQLASGKTDHFTREVASGLWQEILQVLNRMTRTMAQRMRLVKGLSAYAASQVVENVMHKDELQTFGERRKIAILMSDLRGFTEMSNSLEPEVVVRILNMYFEVMIDVCNGHDLIIDKFIGDGLLAYADPDIGTPEEQCERALSTARDMLKSLAELNLKLKAMNLPNLQIGLGLHYGDVIVGSIGSKDRLQHTIIGDSVNTAARLEAKCKDLKTVAVVSTQLMQLVNMEHFTQFKLHGAIPIRGIAIPVEVYIIPEEATEKKSA